MSYPLTLAGGSGAATGEAGFRCPAEPISAYLAAYTAADVIAHLLE